jgi:hypothetical protein
MALNVVNELLSMKRAPTAFSSLDKLMGLARTRASELTDKDSIYRKSYSSRVPLFRLPRKERVKEIATLHLSRGVQVVTAIYSALSVDGPLEQRDPDWSSVENRHFVCDLALLDIKDLMIPWVKETTAYCACLSYRQTETNGDSLRDVLNTIAPLQLTSLCFRRPGHLGPGDLSKISSWLMAPRRDTPGPSSYYERVRRIGENVTYIKRACPPMLRHVIEGELRKHEARIAREVNNVAPSPEGTEVRDRIKEAIDEIVRRVFRDRSFEPEEQFPSSNASFSTTRRQGGAMGELFGGCTVPFPTIPVPCFLAGSTLDYMVVDDRGQPYCVEVRKSAATQWVLHDWTAGLNATLHHRGSTLHGDDAIRISARPFPIPEPCKIRVITLGEAVEYQRLLSVQKFLWSCVSSFTTFEFTGKPVTDWQRVLDPSEARELCSSGKSLLSGDFSAATDNLDPELSEYVWAAIGRTVWVNDGAGRVPLSLSRWAPLVRQGLTGHSIHYGDRVVPQTWGQLMGSPVSFPILNIVNAATTVVALREHDRAQGERVRSALFYLRTAHVRTNGDDLFFVCPDDCYARWKAVVASAGLKPSLGKNFLSKEFCVINSEMRSLVRAEGPLPAGCDLVPLAWRYESFVNLPILYGMEAKGPNAGKSVLDQLRWWDLEALALSLVDGLDPRDERYARRLTMFERYHRSVLAKVPAGVDWHVPHELGGVGIPAYEGVHPPSEDACRRAGWLACLDAVKRVKCVTPPTSKLVDFWGWIQKQALRRERVVLTRVRQRTDLLLPQRLKDLKRKVGTADLANLVRVFHDVALDTETSPPIDFSREDMWSLAEWISVQYGTEGPKWVKEAQFYYYSSVPEGIAFLKASREHSDTAEAQASVLQRRVQWQVRRQLAAARSSGMKPMKWKNMALWQSNGEIEEVSYAARYTSPVLL